MIPPVVSDAGLHAAEVVVTAGVCDQLCVNPTFGYERYALENYFLVVRLVLLTVWQGAWQCSVF